MEAKATAPRWGMRAEKEWMRRKLRDQIWNVEYVDTVLDLACGRMTLAGRIPSREYIGVDISQDLLDQGLARFPDNTAICSRIEDLDPSVQGDLVTCIECIGINDYFDPVQTLPCIDRMISGTRPGGRLIFNIGSRSREYFDEMEARLRTAFETVQIIRYGRFHGRRSEKAALLLANAMTLLPVLALDEKRNPRRFVVCEGRRKSS